MNWGVAELQVIVTLDLMTFNYFHIKIIMIAQRF